MLSPPGCLGPLVMPFLKHTFGGKAICLPCKCGFKTLPSPPLQSCSPVCRTYSLPCTHLGPHFFSLTFPGICRSRMRAGDGGLSPRARISGFSEQAWEAESGWVALNPQEAPRKAPRSSCPEEAGPCWWAPQSKRLGSFQHFLLSQLAIFSNFFLLQSQVLFLVVKCGI